MIKKSISVTEQQNNWIKAQIETGHYGNDSEIIRELIREKQFQEQENSGEIERIRTKLLKAEQSGYTEQSATEILNELKQEMRMDGNL